MKQTQGNSDSSENVKSKLRPAVTPEARENQMIALAMDLVEERLRNGTASSQETTHFLKLASSREQLEKAKIEKELKMIDAKTKQTEAAANTEKLYQDAIKAMKTYSGHGDSEDEEEEYDS